VSRRFHNLPEKQFGGVCRVFPSVFDIQGEAILSPHSAELGWGRRRGWTLAGIVDRLRMLYKK
jgi:hypothetical protein